MEAYKILMYTNLFGHSHIKMLGAVSDTLTDAGHDLVSLEAWNRPEIGLKYAWNGLK